MKNDHELKIPPAKEPAPLVCTLFDPELAHRNTFRITEEDLNEFLDTNLPTPSPLHLYLDPAKSVAIANHIGICSYCFLIRVPRLTRKSKPNLS